MKQRDTKQSRQLAQSPTDPGPAIDQPGDAERPEHPVVAVAASAEDPEALSRFLATFPAGSGITLIIAQKATRRKALTAELVAAYTAIPVVEGIDGTVLEPDHIYLIPARLPLIVDHLALRYPDIDLERTSSDAIDMIFRSLAADQRENVVCVILSGPGTDGTPSLKTIKEQGGMVIVQSPESARFEGMPRSAAATGLADRVLPLEEIAPRLVEYARYLAEIRATKGLQGLREETADHLSRICAILRRQTGHDFSRYKRSTLVRRIQHRLQVLRETSVTSYLKQLQADPKEVDLLFKDLLIGVTSFFRDPESFEALAQEVLPKIFEGRDADADGPVRVWIPGCASGEEAYTIAILLSEHIASSASGVQAQIFATDIDDEALEFARVARYPESIADHVSPERLARYFVPSAKGYQVSKEIREMCIFSTHNLIKDPPFSRLDLISCRNMLIYLEHDIQKQLIPLFHYSLRPGGYLFLGPSESITGHLELFRTLDKKHRIFQSKNSVIRPPVSFPMMEGRRLSRQQADSGRLIASKEPNIGQTLERILLDQYAPACVIVNEQHEILYFSGRTGIFLEQPSGAPSTNVINMARKGLRLELRTALHKATKLRKQTERRNVAVDSGAGVVRIDLIVRPMIELGEDCGLYMVVFQELGPAQTSEQAAAEGSLPKSEEPIVQQLEHELRTTREYLQATIEELETSNEELTSSNEELLSMNEEIQSANEELQTGKEELQSVNEELQSVNEELNKKVDELDRANSDLQNHFQSTQIATIFLDSALCIKKFTPTATDLFRLIDGDIGRPIIDIAPRFNDRDLINEVREVLRNLSMKERQVHIADAGAWYIMRILPYRTIDNVIDGVVITFVDVTELKRAEERITHLNRDLDNRVSELETLFQVLPVGVAISDDPEGRMVRLNSVGRRIFGAEPDRKGLGTVVDSEALQVRIERDGRPIPRGDMLTARAARAGEAIVREEIRVIRDDGSVVHLMCNASPLLDTDGRVRGAIATFADVTATIAAKLQAEERAMQQAAVAELGVFALREASSDEVIAKAISIVHKTLGTDFVEVLEVRPDGESLLLKGGAGWKDGYVGSTVIGMGFDSQAGYALSSEEPVVVDDVSTEVRFRRSTLLSDHGVVSGASVIIYGKEGPYGALGAHTSTKRRFTHDAISFLQSVANVLGTAIQWNKAVEDLGESRQELLDFIENATVGIHWVDSTGIIIWANQAELDMLGYEREEYIGHHIAEFHVDRGTIDDLLARLVTGEAVDNYEARLRSKDGSIRHVVINSNALEKNGAFIHTRCFTRDVTERRRAEDALRQEEERLRLAVEATSLGTWDYDPVADELAWSDRCKAIFGLPADAEVTYRLFTELLHPDDRAATDAIVRGSLDPAGDGTYDTEFRAIGPLDGAVRWIVAKGQAYFAGKGAARRAVRFLGTVLDITDRKLSEMERSTLLELEQQAREQAEEAQARSLFLAEASGILAASLDHETTLFSLAHLSVPRIADYCYILEIDSEQSVHLAAYAHVDSEKLTLMERIKDLKERSNGVRDSFMMRIANTTEPKIVASEMIEEAAAQTLAEATTTERLIATELVKTHLELEPRSMMLLPLVVRRDIIGMVVLAMSESGREYDVVDRQLGEELARRAATAMDNARLYREAQEANQAKDQFLAVLSHELRTPLTPALASVEALLEHDLPEEIHTYVGLIQRNIELEARLIDDLLDLTRIIKGKLRLDMDVTDVHDLIRNVLDICSTDIAKKKLLLVVDLAAGRHTVRGDSARLNQVCWNIIKNAVKFTPNGGTITLRSRNEGDSVIIEVSDTGIGIDENTLPVIFNAFEQGEQAMARRFGGLGLGLAISKSLVDMHGGHLSASSPGLGLGSTFTTSLPLVGADDASEPPPADPARSTNILVVEDHRDTTGVMRPLLERSGYRIYTAYSLDAAMRIAAEQRFDLLISGAGPEGISSPELLAMLTVGGGVRSIIVGAEPPGYGAPHGEAFLPRPFNARALHELIDRILGA